MEKSIDLLRTEFNPDLIVIGSNTPTIMLELTSKKIIGVNPPIKKASLISKTNNIGILATEVVIKSRTLSHYLKKCKISKKIKIHKINASNLVQLVESGNFIENKKYCKKIIRSSLKENFSKNNIDTVTLSSTHLSFLKPILKSEFPKVEFIDPADNVAEKILKTVKNRQSKKNSLKIFSSDQTGKLTKNLNRIGIKNKIQFLSI